MRGYGAAQGRLLGQRHRPSPLGAQVVTEGKENRAAQTIRLPARHNGMCGPLYRTPPGVWHIGPRRAEGRYRQPSLTLCPTPPMLQASSAQLTRADGRGSPGNLTWAKGGDILSAGAGSGPKVA